MFKDQILGLYGQSHEMQSYSSWCYRKISWINHSKTQKEMFLCRFTPLQKTVAVASLMLTIYLKDNSQNICIFLTTYFKQGTLSRSPSEELLLVEGWDWGGMGCGLAPPTGVGKGGACSPSGVSTSFISYNNRTSSICHKSKAA